MLTACYSETSRSPTTPAAATAAGFQPTAARYSSSVLVASTPATRRAPKIPTNLQAEPANQHNRQPRQQQQVLQALLLQGHAKTADAACAVFDNAIAPFRPAWPRSLPWSRCSLSIATSSQYAKHVRKTQSPGTIHLCRSFSSASSPDYGSGLRETRRVALRSSQVSRALAAKNLRG